MRGLEDVVITVRARDPRARPAGPGQAGASSTPTTTATTPASPASGRPCGWSRSRGPPAPAADHPGPGRLRLHLEPPLRQPAGPPGAGRAERRGRARCHRRGPRRPRPRAPAAPSASRRTGGGCGAPDDPHLYDLRLELIDAHGRGGRPGRQLRRAALGGGRRQGGPLNGQPVFQRLVLDQGSGPDGADDRADRRGAGRRHRAGAWRPASTAPACTRRCSRSASSTTPTGSATWSGASSATGAASREVRREQPAARRVLRHPVAGGRGARLLPPSIVGWCPLNETYQVLHDRITVLDDVTRAMFLATKAGRPTRPVIDASGYAHRVAGDRHLRLAQLRAGPGPVRRAGCRPGEGRAVRQRPRRAADLPAVRGPALFRLRVRRDLVEPGAAPTPAGRGAGPSPGATATGCATRRSSTRGSPV